MVGTLKKHWQSCTQANHLRPLLPIFSFLFHGLFAPITVNLETEGPNALPWHLCLSLVGHGRGRLLHRLRNLIQKVA